jgi:hypothetical protein
MDIFAVDIGGSDGNHPTVRIAFIVQQKQRLFRLPPSTLAAAMLWRPNIFVVHRHVTLN